MIAIAAALVAAVPRAPSIVTAVLISRVTRISLMATFTLIILTAIMKCTSIAISLSVPITFAAALMTTIRVSTAAVTLPMAIATCLASMLATAASPAPTVAATATAFLQSDCYEYCCHRYYWRTWNCWKWSCCRCLSYCCCYHHCWRKTKKMTADVCSWPF